MKSDSEIISINEYYILMSVRFHFQILLTILILIRFRNRILFRIMISFPNSINNSDYDIISEHSKSQDIAYIFFTFI